MRIRRLIIATILASVAACTPTERATPEGDVGGTLLIALPAEPATLLPLFVDQVQDKEIVDQIFDVLAEMGPDLNTLGDAGWSPRLAASWQWAADSLSIAFRLNPGARWHDGRRVSPADVKFSLDLYKDPKVGSRFAPEFADIDSVSTPDSTTAVAWYARRSPEQFYNLAYNLMILPEHLLRDANRADLRSHPFGRSPVGSGPFKFVRWEARSALEVEADSGFQVGRPLLDRVIWMLNRETTSALVSVLAGDVDVLETVSLQGMTRIAGQDLVKAVPYASPNYAYMGFNFRDSKNPGRPHSLFADAELRRALSMAIDRRLLLTNAYDSLAALPYGPFSRVLATADTTIPVVGYDSVGADHLLDSLGWRDGNGDGVRDKGGRQLRFGLLVPSVSVGRMRYAELIQAQMRSHGVRVDIDAVEPPVFTPRMRSGQFDAVINAFSTDPSPRSVREAWHTATAGNRASNFLLYSNPVVDAQLDSALNGIEPARSLSHYRNAYRGIVADNPAVWLYELRNYMAVNARVKPVVHPGFWWRYLRLWSIPAAGRLPRDGS